MKTIIAVTGTRGCGKTSSICLAYEMLLKAYPDAKIVNHWPAGRARKDINATVIIGRVKLGFNSMGDPYSHFPERLDKLVSENCSIIICATRTRGETYNAVEVHSKKFNIDRVFKKPALDVDREKENKVTAKLILKKIESALQGR